MNWRGWIKSKKVRIYSAATISLIIILVLLSHLLANKSKSEFQTIYGNMSAVNGTLVCDTAQTEANYSYDAFYKTRANPENYLASTAQKKGYDISADIRLANSLSHGINTSISYNPANIYLTGRRQSSKLDVYLYQGGLAKVSCGNKKLTIPVSHDQPVVEIRFSQ